MNPGKVWCFVSAYLLIAIVASGQQASSLTKSIDSLFVEWNHSTGPGGAVVVVRNDSVLYAKGFGMASLEHPTPITTETAFNIASLSKQFTGYAIVSLVKAGKLKLDDDVRQHLPWLPRFHDPITIRQLLHHTSGIRDHLLMAIYGGTGYNGLITQDYAVKYIKNYQGLNFEPGEQHAYSNSNYVLLAEIIKSVSGRSFNAYIDSLVFKPLGMTRSLFVENPASLVANRALSYSRSGDGWSNQLQNVYTVGDGGMVSTITDMGKWAMHLYSAKGGAKEMVGLLTQPGVLNSGYPLPYAMGIGALRHKGHTLYQHSGSIAGYRSVISVFPDLKTGIVILSNAANARTGVKVAQVADLLLKGVPSKEGMPFAVDSSKLLVKDTALVKSLAGDYMADDGFSIKLSFTNGQLLLARQGQPGALWPEGRNRWRLAADTGVALSILATPKDTTLHYYNYGNAYKLVRYRVDSGVAQKDLAQYAGDYYSAELDTRYTISVVGGRLVLTTFQFGESKLVFKTPDDLFIENGRNHLRMVRNAKKEVVGFDLSNAFLTRLRFHKVKELSEPKPHK